MKLQSALISVREILSKALRIRCPEQTTFYGESKEEVNNSNLGQKSKEVVAHQENGNQDNRRINRSDRNLKIDFDDQAQDDNLAKRQHHCV